MPNSLEPAQLKPSTSATGPSFGERFASRAIPLSSSSTNFTRLSIKHDADSRVNMYYLKDLIVKKIIDASAIGNQQQALYVYSHVRTTEMLEKLHALAKMRKHSNVVVFMQALRSLFSSKDYCFFNLEPLVQVEVIHAASTSVNFPLLENFQRLLDETEKRAELQSNEHLFELAD